MARYIDAEKLKEHIKDLPTWWADGGGVYGKSMKYPEGMFDCEDIINSIDNAPTADVAEVKHGEWAVNVGMNFNKERICPICKKKIEGNCWNFCSNCGAKMDGKSK